MRKIQRRSFLKTMLGIPAAARGVIVRATATMPPRSVSWAVTSGPLTTDERRAIHAAAVRYYDAACANSKSLDSLVVG